jgi:DNA modification methylase
MDDVALAERMRQKKSMIAVGERTDGSTRTRIHDETIGKGIQFKSDCNKCGATRIDAQLGLESTPEEYVANLVEVFRGVKRVLRDDGTLWLILGDSYNNFRSQMGPGQAVHGRNKLNGKPAVKSRTRGTPGLKEKDLVGIPWRVAFALQADGWYLRQDIIWHKTNPMPESVTDRCTKAHEYIFLLSKSAKYWYDHEAIKEPAAQPDRVRNDIVGGASHVERGQHSEGGEFNGASTRNKRSVWTVTIKPFKGAHFATFPPDLIRPCILAGCPRGGTVLDPFAGAGTTLLVATEEGRNSIGIELNPEYAEITRKRLANAQLSLSLT